MEKKDVIEFFDRLAPLWDADMVRNEKVIKEILDTAGAGKDCSVLDVACGTGVLFPDYFAREVASLTGIDISPEMVKTASGKFPRAEIICGDAEGYDFGRLFDSIVIYNAFPHFPHPEALIKNLSSHLEKGGRLTVAHGMSREALLKHHSGSALKVSLELPEADELAGLMSKYLCTDTVISDSEKYIVSAVLK